MAEEQIIKKKKTFYLCGECNKDLTTHNSGSDIFAGLFSPPTLYCENNDCKHFGLLKVVGIKQEREV